MTEPADDDDTLIVICSPLSIWPLPAIQGATIRNCHSCNGQVWVAPTSRESIRNAINHRIVCLLCHTKEMAEDKSGDACVVTVTPQQLAELKANMDGGQNLS